MCGILGYYLFNNSKPVEKSIFDKALNMLSHRGPDDEGTWHNADGSVCFGHKRLSIIDLSANAHQPMVSGGGKFIVSFNGEIYNFSEINSELESKCTPKTKSDTETLLNSYSVWGENCLDRFRGMFSFAIYDEEKDTVFFARDRLGIKPFYYIKNEYGFYFSSEIKPLFEISDLKKKIRKESVLEYFAFGKIHSPYTMFEGIYKLPSACYGMVSGNKFSINKYWTPYKDRYDFSSINTEKDYEERLFELFRESVSYRLVSDVPVGIFLSGGVDSTGILGMINHLGKSKDVFTYSAGFENQGNYDERVFAKRASEYYGTNHFEITIKKEDLIGSLPEILKNIDEPISDSTIIPIYFLSELARKNGSIVILNGDGADELFAGYSKWIEYNSYLKYWKLINSSPDFLKSFIGFTASLITGGKRKQVIYDIVNRAKMKTQFYIGDTGALKGTSLFYNIINPEIYNIFNSGYSEFNEIKKSDDYTEWMSYWGLKSMVENIFLYRADRMGMANSIEIRVPYIDHKMVEFGMQMPQDLKYKNNTGKYILKKSLERIVPNEFLYRKKMGFCVPVKEWSGREIYSEVFPAFYKINSEIGLFDDKVISEFENLVNEEKTGAEGSLLLNLHIFINWYKQWFN